ncbi:hypothetical protein [uncultured Clostridium sp.]|uniref:hypothetical protein n=1 Tax=uncultured Clostridium sp. TaxID=59620 RepID=UPI00262EB01A|nr:hypothetical protein [uncultured Clostridium sp.]
MKLRDNYLDQIDNHIAVMELDSKMGLNEKAYVRSLKANYVQSVVSDMFIITMLAIVISIMSVIMS